MATANRSPGRTKYYSEKQEEERLWSKSQTPIMFLYTLEQNKSVNK